MIIIDSTLMQLPAEPVAVYTADKIKNEPMLFSCDVEAAWRMGGEITRDCLRSLFSVVPKGVCADAIVDSRVHMLMPGFYPCIPGWHHDDVDRTRPDDQPNYLAERQRVRHMAMLVNAHNAPTLFATGKVEMPEVPLGQGVYKAWHPVVEEHLAAGRLTPFSAPDRKWVCFDDHTFHRGTEATHFGWRYFIRVSFDSRRPKKNEIRRQVQVYLSDLNGGW